VAVSYLPLSGEGTWQAPDFAGPQDWTVEPGADLVPELRRRLWAGRGLAVVRLDPALSDAELQARYWDLCTRLGTVLPQTVSGTLVYPVRDEGYTLERDYGAAGVRTSKTTAGFGFHTDSPSRLAGHTPEVIGLLVLRTAKSGGESTVVSGPAVHNAILEERPEYLERLYRPYWVDRRAELPPGEPPVLPVPVFERREGLVVRYVRLYIEKGAEVAGVPLTESDIAPLDYFEEVAGRQGLALQVPLERGDIQFVNNTFLLHSRNAYEDYAEPERKRHYVRVWLAE
jgi:hypothetical protein